MAVFYYRVPITTGPKGRHQKPDLPAGVPYVGNHDGRFYLVKTTQEIEPGPDRARITPVDPDVRDEARARGLATDDVVNKWAIGGQR